MAERTDPRQAGRSGPRHRRLQLIQYRPGVSFLHRLDPRTKLVALVTVSAAALLFSSPAALALAFLFVFSLALFSRMGKRILRALTLVAPLFVLVIVLDSLFSKVTGGQVYFSGQVFFLHPEVTTAGIIFAVSMGLRLLTLAGISFLFIMTTSPDDLVRSLRTMRVPVAVTFPLGFALRSMTALAEDTRQIIDAQRSRALELDRGNLIKNRDKLAALFVPVTVSLLKRSKHTADAMQARGFSMEAHPSCYRPMRFGRPDLVMVIALAGLVIALVAICMILP